jgi:carboxylesterase
MMGTPVSHVTFSGAAVPVAVHAEPFSAAGNRTGVLLLHGFTGSPASMRPWGEYLAGVGFTVEVPCLPGHGTSWQDLNLTTWQDWYAGASRGLDKLLATCSEVFVAGLSMGGCLALRLAAERPDDVAGLILVNPSVASTDRRLVLIPFLKRVIGSISAIGNDISLPGADEDSYDRTPLKALDSLRAMWKATRDDLPKVTAPLVVFRSAEDHVVEPLSTQIVTQRVSSRDLTEQVLHNSYHVATLDHDAPVIFRGSVAFIERLSISRHSVAQHSVRHDRAV